MTNLPSPPSSPPQQPPPPPQPTSEFPPVDPTNFDLIILGTGLPESIISAAASTAGKSVLHLDPNPFYGSHFSSLSPPDFSSFLLSPPSSHNSDAFSLSSTSLYSNVEISPFPDDFSPKFQFDVSGPRVLFCADSAIDLLLKSGVNAYLEFKSVDLCLIYDCDSGRLVNVPESRNSIFKDQSLSLTDKLWLNKFFKLVQEYLSGENDGIISEEDLDRPFIDFLNNNKLPRKTIWFILYAIALADYDQENVEACKELLKTKDGIDRLALYHSSVGRFPNAPGAMLYPMYGQGELPQAFCRRAAVKGCIYVLRMPITSLLVDKDTGLYSGVRLASGQDIFSQKLLIDPQFEVPQALALSRPDGLQGRLQSFSPRDTSKVTRGICITKTSLVSDASNLFVVIPPRSLYPEQATSVRVLQLGSSSAMCHMGMFVVHLSTLCDDASQGKKVLNSALKVLFEQRIHGSSETKSSENPKDNSASQSEITEKRKPVLEWSTLYIQEITEESIHTISRSPSPDGNLSYNSLIDITKKMFQQMFPGEEFFPENASTEDPENAEDIGPE